MLFPEGDGRVPLVSVTGTNGKTTVTRMAGHVLASTGLTVGVTTTDGSWVGGRDRSAVGVITNIQPDHFGQDGIRSLEDLVYIKSLVAERVCDGGTPVLNADDEQLVRLADAPARSPRFSAAR
jgi:cyanophycin synthetase